MISSRALVEKVSGSRESIDGIFAVVFVVVVHGNKPRGHLTLLTRFYAADSGLSLEFVVWKKVLVLYAAFVVLVNVMEH